MVCYYPVEGWRSKHVNKNGKRPVVFNIKDGYADMPIKVPCGRCIGCRLDRSRMWAVRCVHEAQMYDDNCFITLTYNPESLPEDMSLHVDHFQKFMKRLRKKTGAKIRYFHCGEYGDTSARPHYHACIFGFDFPDRQLWSVRDDVRLYTSQLLTDTWGLGYCVIGDVTFESAAYVARYIMKKVNGEQAESHYQWVDPATGEIHRLAPEYITMSKGIGRAWLEKFKSDCYPRDYVVLRGVKMKPPKGYDRILELTDEDMMKKVRRTRLLKAKQNSDNTSSERLAVREKVKRSQLNKLVRGL